MFGPILFRGLEWKSRKEKKWDIFINQKLRVHSSDNSRSYLSRHTDIKNRYVCIVSLIPLSLVRGYSAVAAIPSDFNMFFLFYLILLLQCFVCSCFCVEAHIFVVPFWIKRGKMQWNKKQAKNKLQQLRSIYTSLSAIPALPAAKPRRVQDGQLKSETTLTKRQLCLSPQVLWNGNVPFVYSPFRLLLWAVR